MSFIGNTVSNNNAVAGDGSTSAGFLASVFFGPGTGATFKDNIVSNSTTAVGVGVLDTDASNLIFQTGNDFCPATSSA